MCVEKTKLNEKEASVGPFLKKTEFEWNEFEEKE